MKYTIEMIPIAKERGRVAMRGGRAHCYTPIRTVVAEEYIALRILELGIEPYPVNVSLRLVVGFYMPRPKSVKRKCHIVKPDTSNLLKLFEDACKNIFRDQQLVDVHAWKEYAAAGTLPRITFEIREVT